MIAIIGLGNIGKQYENTHHNVGFMCIDNFAKAHNLEFTKDKYDSHFCQGIVNGQKVCLLKPKTYMNLSGKAVSQLVNSLKLPLENIIVVYDDIDLAVGQLRLRKEGSAGTHNGMKSIIECVGSNKFSRLRIGIGRNEKMDLASFVLSKISKDDQIVLNTSFGICTKILDKVIDNNGDVSNIDITKF